MSKEKIISINFNEEPDIRDRGIKDTDPEPIKQNKIKFPFELYNTVTITVKTNKREFNFDIYNGYVWNGADIPKTLWILIGSRYNPEFRIASMIHDYMLQFKKYMLDIVLKNEISISEYRRLTSLIFREKIKAQGTNVIKANIMSWAVDVFQHYCNKKGWKLNENQPKGNSLN